MSIDILNVKSHSKDSALDSDREHAKLLVFEKNER